jgi:hypothetical protein
MLLQFLLYISLTCEKGTPLMSQPLLRFIFGISILAMSLSGCGGKAPVVEPTNVITASEPGNNKPPFPGGSPGNKNKTGGSGAPNGPSGGSPPNGPGGSQPRK